MKKTDEMCRIPIRATMQKIDGKYVMVDAEYVDVPATAIAEYLLKSFGISAIFGGEDEK